MCPESHEIAFLLKQGVVFVCEKCGEVVTMSVPSEGNYNEKSYCCRAKYMVAMGEYGDISVIRVEDEKDVDVKVDVVRARPLPEAESPF